MQQSSNRLDRIAPSGKCGKSENAKHGPQGSRFSRELPFRTVTYKFCCKEHNCGKQFCPAAKALRQRCKTVGHFQQSRICSKRSGKTSLIDDDNPVDLFFIVASERLHVVSDCLRTSYRKSRDADLGICVTVLRVLTLLAPRSGQ